MIKVLKVFHRETMYEKSKTIVEISAVLDKEHRNVVNVNTSAFNVGPRGGGSFGMGPGFSIAEWDLINAQIALLDAGLKTRMIVIPVGEPWNNDITCTKCNETFTALDLMKHRQTEQHKNAVGF